MGFRGAKQMQKNLIRHISSSREGWNNSGMTKTPSKDELTQIEHSVNRASLRVAIGTTGVPATERRLLSKGLKLLPKGLHPLFEASWNSSLFKSFFWFKVPFRDIEIQCARL